MRSFMLLTLVIASCQFALAADRTIVKEVTVAASPSEVWKAWSTSEGLKTFFAPHATVELRPGGKFEILFSKAVPAGIRGSEGCQVLSYLPERMLSFSWNAPPQLGAGRFFKTFVVIELIPEGSERTKVRLSNSGYGSGEVADKVHSYFSSAWGFVLASLEKRFKDGPVAWPEEKPVPASALESLPLPEKVMAEMLKFVGGKWTGQVKGADGPMDVEFTYERSPDGKGMVGRGVIGVGRKDAVHIRNAFGIDPLSGAVYYLDSHGTGTVYFGHVTLEEKALMYVFGHAGGRHDQFTSRGQFSDPDTYETIIKQADGQEVAGFVLRRIKK